MSVRAKQRWPRRAVFAGAVLATTVLAIGVMPRSAAAQYAYYYGYPATGSYLYSYPAYTYYPSYADPFHGYPSYGYPYYGDRGWSSGRGGWDHGGWRNAGQGEDDDDD